MSSVPSDVASRGSSAGSPHDAGQTSTLQNQSQQTSPAQANDATSQTKKQKSVVSTVSTDDGIDENNEAQGTSSRGKVELPNNANEAVESHRDTKARFYKPYPAEEAAKVAEERKSQKSSQQKQIDESPVPETVETVASTSTTLNPPETTTTVDDASSSEQHQKPHTEVNTKAIDEEVSPNILPSESPSNEPPAPHVTPSTSPTEGILNASIINSENNTNLRNHFSYVPVQNHHNIDTYATLLPVLDDSYSSEPLDYPHQPRFPPSSNSLSRTQQRLLLQRQHYFTDDENYLIHPRNQKRLTKVIERINKEHAAILLYRDPMIESLQRAFTRYAQDHPEVLDDDFGASYEDSKEWGILDQRKNLDQLGSAGNIVGTEALTTESLTFK